MESADSGACSGESLPTESFYSSQEPPLKRFKANNCQYTNPQQHEPSSTHSRHFTHPASSAPGDSNNTNLIAEDETSDSNSSSTVLLVEEFINSEEFTNPEIVPDGVTSTPANFPAAAEESEKCTENGQYCECVQVFMDLPRGKEWHVFVSHSTGDQRWTRESLIVHLRDYSYKVAACYHFMPDKSRYNDRAIYEHLRKSCVVVIVLSEGYLRSPRCNKEWEQIVNLVKEKRISSQSVIVGKISMCSRPEPLKPYLCLDFIDQSKHDTVWSTLLHTIGTGVNKLMPAEPSSQTMERREITQTEPLQEEEEEEEQAGEVCSMPARDLSSDEGLGFSDDGRDKNRQEQTQRHRERLKEEEEENEHTWRTGYHYDQEEGSQEQDLTYSDKEAESNTMCSSSGVSSCNPNNYYHHSSDETNSQEECKQYSSTQHMYQKLNSGEREEEEGEEGEQNPKDVEEGEISGSEIEPEQAKKIESFYDRLARPDADKRNQSPIFYMRNFNNWVKSILIRTYLPPKATVLDLCCGKGGDLLKWKEGRILQLVCADISGMSIEQCQERYSSNKMRRNRNLAYDAEFVVADLCEVRLRDRYKNPGTSFHLSSCQFSLHYAFESYQRAHMMLLNACENLRPGGFFIGTTVDANELLYRLRQKGPTEDGVWCIGNNIFSVTMDQELDLSGDSPLPLFGAKYNFKLHGVVDLPEFLLHFPLLCKMLEEFEMELVLRQNFYDFFAEHREHPDNSGLMYRMQAFDKSTGTMSRDEWEVIGLYLVFVFQKKKTGYRNS